MDTHHTHKGNRLGSEAGVTSIEYALVASLIAVTITSAIGATGSSLGALYTRWAGSIIAAISPG